MNVLAFTTSTDHGSVALAQKGEVTAVSQWTRTSQGSEILTYRIKLLLMRAKVSLKNIDLIAVDKGPGSFTGCRIAVNVAKTIAMTLEKPLVAEFSLDIIAMAALKELGPSFNGRIVTLLDAHKSLFYCRWYNCRHSQITALAPHIQALSLADVQKLFLVGGQAPSSKTLVVAGQVPHALAQVVSTHPGACLTKKVNNVPHAKTLARMALTAPTIGWNTLEPSYIRSPDAVEKLLQSRQESP